jgi:hypothetical protein
LPDIKHQKGAIAELVVAEHMVAQGYYVFSPVVSQQGPVDIICVNDDGDIILIDAKYDSQRINPGRNKPARIHRTRNEVQKLLGVRIAYVSADRKINFVPAIEELL